MNVVLIHELLKATAMQGFLPFIFHSQADTEIRGMLDDKTTQRPVRFTVNIQ